MINEGEARRRLLEWNFDPEDVTKETTLWYDAPARKENCHIIDYDRRVSSSLIIFSQLGSIDMVRYILSKCKTPVARKEELAKTDEHGLFPLYVAIARNRKQEDVLEVCKFLLEQGADLSQTLGDEYSPLFRACAFGYDKVALWLLSEGALLTESDNKYRFEVSLAQRDLPFSSHSCDGWVQDRTIRKLFDWARETVTTRKNFLLFMSGSLVAPPATGEVAVAAAKAQIRSALTANEHASEEAASLLLRDLSDQTLQKFWKLTKVTSSSSPLAVFSTYPGILEHIGRFVGLETKGRVLCTAKGLVEYEQQWNSA